MSKILHWAPQQHVMWDERKGGTACGLTLKEFNDKGHGWCSELVSENPKWNVSCPECLALRPQLSLV